MTRARELSKLGNTNIINVDSSYNVGIGSLTPDAKLDVIGIISATSFSGDGSELTGIVAGADLSPGSGAQRVVVTSKTSGTMDTAATDANLSWNSTTNTLSAPTLSGNITGTAATFSGDVSIGGVLTYDDVTNVDSVGVVTARSGIKVGAGKSISAVSGTLTYYGDGSNLDGIESGVGNYVASGTIDNGATVILKDDGTVGIATMVTSDTPSVGISSVFLSADTRTITSVYDSTTDKIVVFFTDYGPVVQDIGKVVVGNVTGTGITFGTPTTFNSGNSKAWYPVAAPIGGGKLVVEYTDGAGKGQAKVGTIDSSTNTISFGSSSEFHSGGSSFDHSTAGYAGTDTVAIAYRDANNSNHGYVSIGSVDTSANTITFGTPVNFGSFNTEYISTTYDTINDKLIISYRNQPSNDRGEVIAGDVSGLGVTFGPSAPAQFDGSGGIVFTSTTFDSTNGKIVIAYRDGGSPYAGLAIVGFVTTNNAVSLGSTVEFASAVSSYTTGYDINNVYDSTNNRVSISYQGTDPWPGKVIVGTVNGDTISFGSSVVFNSSICAYYSATFDSTNDKVVIVYKHETWTQPPSNWGGNAVVLSPTSQATNLTTDNYIGIAGEAISNAATGKINIIGGTNTGQSGLTTAQTYYVATTGILTTTADTPSVVAGTSISDTEILVWKS